MKKWREGALYGRGGVAWGGQKSNLECDSQVSTSWFAAPNKLTLSGLSHFLLWRRSNSALAGGCGWGRERVCAGRVCVCVYRMCKNKVKPLGYVCGGCLVVLDHILCFLKLEVKWFLMAVFPASGDLHLDISQSFLYLQTFLRTPSLPRLAFACHLLASVGWVTPRESSLCVPGLFSKLVAFWCLLFIVLGLNPGPCKY